MKALRILIALGAIFAAAGYLVLVRFQPEFPLERTIVNQDGKSLEATILGKKDGILTIERSSDGARFEIPTSTLSLNDRLLAFRLPEKVAPAPPLPAPEDSYIENRKRRINELKAKAEVMKKEIASQTLNTLLQRSRTDELAAVEKEIRTHEVALETYRYRQR